MDTDFDSEFASELDWVVIEPALQSPPLARPIFNRAPRIPSGYSLSVDGQPILRQSGASSDHCFSSTPARATGSALARPSYSSKSSGWEPPSGCSRAKPLARPPVGHTSAASLELPRELPCRDPVMTKCDISSTNPGTLPMPVKPVRTAQPALGTSAAVPISEDQHLFSSYNFDPKIFTGVWSLLHDHVRTFRQCIFS